MNRHGTEAYYWNFAMPNRNTFSIPSIAKFLKDKLKDCNIIIDPFARDSKFGTITNDLNPEVSADYNMKADDFLQMLIDNGVKADAILLDPPYSPRQVKECYDNLGLDVTSQDTQTSKTMSKIRTLASQVLKVGGIGISFGWDSTGLGRKNGVTKKEVHILPHGSTLHDTIITLDEKVKE
tara:strand:+ start:358 stop:897 length:540 start_codon:yes stop_codon:yes gene_type:complete